MYKSVGLVVTGIRVETVVVVLLEQTLTEETVIMDVGKLPVDLALLIGEVRVMYEED